MAKTSRKNAGGFNVIDATIEGQLRRCGGYEKCEFQRLRETFHVCLTASECYEYQGIAHMLHSGEFVAASRVEWTDQDRSFREMPS